MNGLPVSKIRIDTIELQRARGNKKHRGDLRRLTMEPGYLGMEWGRQATYLLYLTPAARNGAYEIARKRGFKSARIVDEHRRVELFLPDAPERNNDAEHTWEDLS